MSSCDLISFSFFHYAGNIPRIPLPYSAKHIIVYQLGLHRSLAQIIVHQKSSPKLQLRCGNATRLEAVACDFPTASFPWLQPSGFYKSTQHVSCIHIVDILSGYTPGGAIT